MGLDVADDGRSSMKRSVPSTTTYADMRTFGIDELRQHSAKILFCGSHGELDALALHFCMKLLKAGHIEPHVKFAGRIFLWGGMESESSLAGSKLAPTWRLELNWQADHVSVKLDRAIHSSMGPIVCHVFDGCN